MTYSLRTEIKNMIWSVSGTLPMDKALIIANRIVDRMEADNLLAKPGSNLELHENGTKKWIKVVPLAKWNKGDLPPLKDGVYQDPQRPSSIYTRRFGNWTHNTGGTLVTADIPSGLVLLAEFPQPTL